MSRGTMARESRDRVDRRSRAYAIIGAALLIIGSLTPAHAERPLVYAITGATVITAPAQTLESATLVLRDGLIEAVGADVVVPADAEVIDGEGMTVYAGWIDAYSHLGMQPPAGGDGGGFSLAALFAPGDAEEPGTGHPIELVHPQYRVTSDLIADDGEIEKRRKLGFTAALAAPRGGVYRGWSALITLSDGHPRDMVVSPVVAQHVGFDAGQFFGSYPSDILGTIATIRQVHYDSLRYNQWRQRYDANPSGMPRPEYNDAMEALATIGRDGRGVFVHAGSNLAIERTLHLVAEFGATAFVTVLGSGLEHEMLEVLAGTEAHFIVPVDYPDDPDVSNPKRLHAVSLQSLQRWEKAAGNGAALEAAGITFALTPYGMSNATKFADNVRKAIEAGLSEATALAAVTTVPAALLDASAVMGTIEAGKIANVVVATGAPFGEETEIRHVFVDGHHYEIEAEEQVGDPDAVVDPRGEWAVTVTVMGNVQNATWTIEGSEGSYSGRSLSDQGETEFGSVTLEGNAMTVVIAGPMGQLEATVVIEGDEFTGSSWIDIPNGQSITLSLKGERISGPEGGER